MGRPARWDSDDILDAASTAVWRHGPAATVGQIATALGAPTGSLYHRYPGRDDLLVALWLRSLARFHERYLAALDGHATPLAAGTAAAVEVVRFSREDQQAAGALLLFSQAGLLARPDCPRRDEVSHANDRVVAALAALVARFSPDADQRQFGLTMTACEATPYGLVRPYLAERRAVPDWLDDAVAVSARSMLLLAFPDAEAGGTEGTGPGGGRVLSGTLQ